MTLKILTAMLKSVYPRLNYKYREFKKFDYDMQELKITSTNKGVIILTTFNNKVPDGQIDYNIKSVGRWGGSFRISFEDIEYQLKKHKFIKGV